MAAPKRTRRKGDAYTPEVLYAKRQEAWNQRSQGFNIRDIALEMGENEDTVRSWLNWWAKNGTTEAGDIEPRMFYRKLSLDQLIEMQAALAPRVVDGDEDAIALSLRVQERISKLLGLDEPTQVRVHGKTVNYQLNGVNPEDI